MDPLRKEHHATNPFRTRAAGENFQLYFQVPATKRFLRHTGAETGHTRVISGNGEIIVRGKPMLAWPEAAEPIVVPQRVKCRDIAAALFTPALA